MPRPSQVARHGPPSSYVLDGEVYALTGGWWPLMDHLVMQDWRLPLLLDVTHPDDAGVLVARLTDPGDDLGLVDVEPIADALVHAATGEPWWVAARLLASADGDWAALDGWCLAKGVDLAALVDRTPARACNLVYAWLIEGADSKARDKLDHRLRLPPPEEIRAPSARTQEWLAESEGGAFMDAMNAMRSDGLVRRPIAEPVAVLER